MRVCKGGLGEGERFPVPGAPPSNLSQICKNILIASPIIQRPIIKRTIPIISIKIVPRKAHIKAKMEDITYRKW